MTIPLVTQLSVNEDAAHEQQVGSQLLIDCCGKK